MRESKIRKTQQTFHKTIQLITGKCCTLPLNLPLLMSAVKYLVFNHTTRADKKEAERPNANRSVLIFVRIVIL